MLLLKFRFLLTSCIICSFALEVIAGKLDILDIKHKAVEDTTIGTNDVSERSNDIADIKLEASENATTNEISIRQNGNCGWSYGCKNGYCWSNCRGGLGVLVFDGDGPEWCWTTKTFSQSYQYIRCSSKNECGNCYKCGGPCSVG